MATNPVLITILGATASGKTAVAAHLALRLNGEIISGDSRQVYRGMDIGTGKDLDEYCVDGVVVPYHLIDIVDAGCKYNLYEYCGDFSKAYFDVCGRGKQPILCGGSGLYIEAVVNGYALPCAPEDAELRSMLEELSSQELLQKLSDLHKLHTVVDTSNRRRLIRAIEIAMHQPNPVMQPHMPLRNVYFRLTQSRDIRRYRTTERLQQRLRNGLVEEVQGLMAQGVSAEMLCWYGLEYKYIAFYLTGALTYEQMVERLTIAIHQFSKRQMTWFRGMERRGAVIHDIDSRLLLDKKLDAIERIFCKAQSEQ
jgi:tRNA dimethylallyltransferase